MAIAKWSALSLETNIAGTALDNRANGTTTFIADIDNTTNRDLYLSLWFNFASFTISAPNPSIAVILRGKRSGVYAENNLERLAFDLQGGAGTRAFSLESVLRIPKGGTYGLYWTSNLGANTASSGNSLFAGTFGEEIV